MATEGWPPGAQVVAAFGLRGPLAAEPVTGESSGEGNGQLPRRS
jgi:hypothetical protein